MPQLPESEAYEELTPLSVQRQILTLDQSHGHNRSPKLTLPQCLQLAKAQRRASWLGFEAQETEGGIQI